MAQAHTRYIALATRPRTDRFKVVYHQVVFLNRKFLDLLIYFFGTVLFKGPEKIYTPAFPEEETDGGADEIAVGTALQCSITEATRCTGIKKDAQEEYREDPRMDRNR